MSTKSSFFPPFSTVLNLGSCTGATYVRSSPFQQYTLWLTIDSVTFISNESLLGNIPFKCDSHVTKMGENRHKRKSMVDGKVDLSQKNPRLLRICSPKMKKRDTWQSVVLSEKLQGSIQLYVKFCLFHLRDRISCSLIRHCVYSKIIQLFFFRFSLLMTLVRQRNILKWKFSKMPHIFNTYENFSGPQMESSLT